MAATSSKARPSLRTPLGRPALSRAMGGSRLWTVIVIGAATLRVLRRLRSKDGEPLYRTVVRPGDRFEVIARAPR